MKKRFLNSNNEFVDYGKVPSSQKQINSDTLDSLKRELAELKSLIKGEKSPEAVIGTNEEEAKPKTKKKATRRAGSPIQESAPLPKGSSVQQGAEAYLKTPPSEGMKTDGAQRAKYGTSRPTTPVGSNGHEVTLNLPTSGR